MDYFTKTFGAGDKVAGEKTDDRCIFIRGNVRISVLTSRLIRIERSSCGVFCDLPTQSVMCRDFDRPAFTVTDNSVNFAVKTDEVSFIFNSDGELIQAVLKGNKTVSDFHKGNLMGTRRTLDNTNGKASLNEGILSREGAAVFDDSSSFLLTPDGGVKPRNDDELDIYVFAYGHDYISAVRDLYNLTGHTPLIPRFALGNWWSRYKAYTQEEYLSLMQRFIDEEIPITVATVDMDWHWTDVTKRFGKDAKASHINMPVKNKLMASVLPSGWTGYSWNTELFPDYREFLNTLHRENLKVTVNLHPCDGVRFFEDAYPEFAEFMGIDPKSKQAIEFDITDRKFTEGYFKFLHHKYEDEGVDFWWIDWQQGNLTNIPGLDPLWALNHYHSLDSERDNKRPLILSRYAGVGGHRYPLGFSGDAAVTWKTLDFQPYFTATASNIGYSWWSHDIGGHNLGIRDDELYIRWVQFGVFSPIMRLHSTQNELSGKEPWKYSHEAQTAATAALRFRHRLIPYIYTMNRRTNACGRALIEPMYYHYPENDNAYEVPNEYFFGSELIAAPITKKASKRLRMACAEVWLPQGRWTDIFTGRIYHCESGEKRIKMFRDTSSIPVLAKAGAIIPLNLNDRENNWKNPESMELYIYRGQGCFTLYEDDGESKDYQRGAFAQTAFAVTEKDGDCVFTVSPAEGDISVLPAKRAYTLSFKDISKCEKINVSVNGKRTSFKENKTGDGIKIAVEISPEDRLRVTLKNITARENPPKKEMVTELLSKVQGSNDLKLITLSGCLKDGYNGGGLPKGELRDAVGEIFD
ncbi:MAG: DUF5110 domain-containing protein [Clostridiales bacterium]|nr:DUF5110 domain-containing protein [Clostridiales bacterium]